MIFILAVTDWLKSQSLLEISGVISGILCVYLAAKNNIWNWPLAIISVLIYTFIFFEEKLYADAGLQIYFLFTNIYGWYFWTKKSTEYNKTPVSFASKKLIFLSILSIFLFAFLLGTFLFKSTDAAFPYIDSFCTACSLVAQLFLARKIIENWLIWIFVDIIYIGVYLIKDLHLTAGMYAIYVLIAIMGYINWKKEYKQSKLTLNIKA
ncbi:nicotinamide riboside transporter PnuC [Daejeonella sp.]|jgi:nicotinamide mononucleotide transporter|uniref:nicotinamide riboside transporter PnuC n=1 Tax=Daejeonella sp. TaxID=2805397 RepID=UPI0037BF3C74